MANRGVDDIRNVSLDFAVAFLCIGNAEPYLRLLGVVDDAMMYRIG